MATPVYLSSEDVRGLATPAEFVEAVREGYRQRGEGAPARPRQVLTSDDPAGMLTGYTAILPDTGVMGGYTYSAGFAAGDAWFVTQLFDATSGELLAIVDGAWMNPFKTGAAGGVAVDALARADADRVGLFGSGPQAAGQLRATAAVRELSSVAVYSPTAEHRRSFAREFDGMLDADVSAVDEPRAAVTGRDVVITATDSREPVFDGSWLEDGTHVTAMGQYHPEAREVDATAVERSRYVPDLRERVGRDAGAFQHAVAAGAVEEDHVHAELGAVVADRAPGRTDPQEITLFDSGGTGIETVAGANLLYRAATAGDTGQSLEWYGADEMLTGRD